MRSEKRRTGRLSGLLSTGMVLAAATTFGSASADGGNGEGGGDSFKPASWYKRYSEYPPYCSTPEEMQTRKIPPLRSDETHLGETKLVHVTTVIRHGARTPWSSRMQCWEGFWQSSETGIWDCDLTTILAPPTPDHVRHEEGDDGSAGGTADNAMFLFEKKYDALLDPADNLSNELNGTCQVGQLLLQGYEQEITNGKFLRDAYLYDGNTFDHDSRMKLVDVSFSKFAPWDEKQLHYRSDDDQRTLMSGQVLLRGMFGKEVLQTFQNTGSYPTIPVHTADRRRDVLDPNADVCPKLRTLEAEALKSDEFQAFNNSQRVQEIRQYSSQHLGNPSGEDMLDCLMTTMCTDRPLPNALDDYSVNATEGESWFKTFAEFDIESYTRVMKYNDAAFAKLSMGPLWAEVMDNINPFINGEVRGDDDNNEDRPPRLALFSGHDTTVMPMLASLGPKLWDDKDWAAYASMMIIEIHEIVDGQTDKSVFPSSHAFRLIYNGKIMTSLIEGCPQDSDMCDARIFKEIVDQFATRALDCSVPETAQTTEPESFAKGTSTVFSSAGGIVLIVLLILVSATIGGFVTFVYLTRRLPFRKRAAVQTYDDSDNGLSVGENKSYDSVT